MKYKKTANITTLVILIAVLSLFTAVCGIVFINDNSIAVFISGIFQNNPDLAAAHSISKNIVLLFIGVPMLLFSFYSAKKGNILGRLMLTGTLGCFLYTYATYTISLQFSWLFVMNALIMSLSFFAFVNSFMSVDVPKLSICFKETIPVNFIGRILIIVGGIIGIAWFRLALIPIIIGGESIGDSNFLPLLIQTIESVLIVPVSIIAGVLIIKEKPFGYLLAVISLITEAATFITFTIMILIQLISGADISVMLIICVVGFDAVLIYCLVEIIRYFEEPRVDRLYFMSVADDNK